jgi:MarR family transcriptional regulator for hemolysin
VADRFVASRGSAARARDAPRTLGRVSPSTPSVAPDAAPTQGPEGLSDDLGWVLLQAARGYLASGTQACGDLPGGLRGYHLMRAVSRGCPSTQAELAAALGLDRTVLTYLLDDLVAAGVVERQADPADRRARRVVVTTLGQRRVTEVAAALAELERSLLAAVPGGDRATLLAALQRISGSGGSAPAPTAADC